MLFSCISYKEQLDSFKDLKNGEADYKCILCGIYCTKKSNCSNRFEQINGRFLDDPCEDYNCDESDDYIFCCDKCIENNKLLELNYNLLKDEDKTIILKDDNNEYTISFIIDYFIRIND